MHDIKIEKNIIGSKQPLYFVADIAANHDGSLKRAYKLIELAKEAGAHAAKFQNFIASKIVSRRDLMTLGGKCPINQSGKNLFSKLMKTQAFPMTGLFS